MSFAFIRLKSREHKYRVTRSVASPTHTLRGKRKSSGLKDEPSPNKQF